MNNQQYAQFHGSSSRANINNRQQSTHISQLRPQTSEYCLSKTRKILPHIIEEYHYNITNQLLDHKIKNPRRDRLIKQSLAINHKSRDDKIKIRKRYVTRHNTQKPEQYSRDMSPIESKANKQNMPSVNRNHLVHKSSSNHGSFLDRSSTCRNYKNSYLINVQNQRMAKRLINTRSMVQDYLQKSFFTYEVYHGKFVNKEKFVKIERDSLRSRNSSDSVSKEKLPIPKTRFLMNKTSLEKSSINNSLQVSHQDITNVSKQDKQDQSIRYKPQFTQAIHRKDIIFIIKNLKFVTNPLLKQDSILGVEFYEDQHDLINILQSKNQNKMLNMHQSQHSNLNCKTKQNKMIKLNYGNILNNKLIENGLIYRLKQKKQILIRFLKIEGIKLNQLGILKLDLNRLYMKNDNRSIFKVKQTKHNRINVGQRNKNLFESSLFRYRKGEVSARVQLEYKLFWDQEQHCSQSNLEF